MKKVVSTEQVAHLWANQEQNEARNANNNFYFANKVIYSYGSHFPICSIETINGEVYYFMTKRGYGNITAKHIRRVHRAIPNRARIVNVFDVPVYSFNQDSNIRKLTAEIIETKKKANRARTNKPYLENEVSALIYNLKIFCELTESKLPDMFDENQDFDFDTYVNNKIAEEREQLKRRKAEDIERATNEINNFRSGSIRSIYGLPFDLLRLSDDRLMVETSRGVTVDIRPVKVLWCLLQSGKDITGRHVANYTIQSVTDKLIKVGCHTFERKEILNLINQME